LQALILETQEKLEKPMIALQKEIRAKLWKEMMDNGMEHIEWSPEDSKAFLDKIDEITFRERSKRIPTADHARIKKMMGY
jgi:hypothetical protein